MKTGWLFGPVWAALYAIIAVWYASPDLRWVIYDNIPYSNVTKEIAFK